MVCENGICTDVENEEIDLSDEYAGKLLDLVDSYKDSEDFEIIQKMAEYEGENEGALTCSALESLKRIEKVFGSRQATINAVLIAMSDERALKAVVRYYVDRPDLWEMLDKWGTLQIGRNFD